MSESDRKTDSCSYALFLHCPQCKQQHIDKGEWETKLHKTHLCEFCKHEWRPFDFYTYGVEYNIYVALCVDEASQEDKDRATKINCHNGIHLFGPDPLNRQSLCCNKLFASPLYQHIEHEHRITSESSFPYTCVVCGCDMV